MRWLTILLAFSLHAQPGCPGVSQAGRMAFVRQQNSVNHIYLMDVDASGLGANPVRLTNDAEAENYPSWSPDGKRLAYQRDFNGSGIYVINGDGTAQQCLSPTPGFDVTPSWSPDGTQIVYARLHQAPQPDHPPMTDIRVMNADGSGDHAVLANTVFSVEPRWSVNGQLVFMSLMHGSNLEIYVMNADGSGVRQLTSDGTNGDPVWSPDGARITFGSDREGGSKLNVFVMNADGSDQKQLTHFDVPIEAGDTNWSSDGKKITFERDISGKQQADPNAYAEVWTMNSDGSGQSSTGVQCSGVGCAPRWQPVPAVASTAQIALQAPVGAAIQELFTMNLDSSNRRQITSDGKNKFLPHFSPDGTRLLYTKFLAGGYDQPGAQTDLAVYDFASGRETLLTCTGQERQPVWSPDGKRIAWIAAGSPLTALKVMNADGSSAHTIGAPSGNPDDLMWGDPAWSSDNWIAFVVAQNSSGCFKTRLDKIRPDGSARTQVTDGGPNCTPKGMEQSGDADPAFSGDGKINYTSRGFPVAPAGAPPGMTERKLYAVSSDPWFAGKPESDLSLPAEPSCIEGVPKGSPDGTRVLLFRACFGSKPVNGIFVTDTAGSYRTKIADGFGADWNPVAISSVPRINSDGIVIHGGVSKIVSPGSLVDIYGLNLATVPVTPGGVQVLVNGTPAPLIYVSDKQIVFQAPYETGVGTATVVAVSNNAPGNSGSMTVQEAAPSILLYGNNRAIALNQDNTLNGAGNGAKPGSVLVAYLIGSGPLDHPIATGAPAPLLPLSREQLPTTVSVDGLNAAVQFAGMAPGFVGLVQLNFVMPDLAPGDYSMQVAIGGVMSNAALVTVH